MKRKRTLRILSLLLTLLMIFSMVPMMALAEDDGSTSIEDMMAGLVIS